MWRGIWFQIYTWTADGDGALPELGPCLHDNSCVGYRRTELATSRFFFVEFDHFAMYRQRTILMEKAKRGMAKKKVKNTNFGEFLFFPFSRLATTSATSELYFSLT